MLFSRVTERPAVDLQKPEVHSVSITVSPQISGVFIHDEGEVVFRIDESAVVNRISRSVIISQPVNDCSSSALGVVEVHKRVPLRTEVGAIRVLNIQQNSINELLRCRQRQGIPGDKLRPLHKGIRKIYLQLSQITAANHLHAVSDEFRITGKLKPEVRPRVKG